jgi:multidrug efflux pump subunit AcrA (membrane-fusion protein)
MADRAHRRRPTIVLAGVAVVVALVAVGGGATWLATRNTASASAGAPVVETSSQTVKVATGTMKQTISASGTLEPAADAALTFGVAGRVTAVKVTVGEKVKRDQTLATIDATALADQVAAARAAVSSDEDQLTTDRDGGAAASALDSDDGQITSAAAQLTAAEAALADATLKATFSGTVASVGLAVGDTVSAGSGGASSTAGGSTAASTDGAAAAAGSASSSASASAASSDAITVISTHTYRIATTVDDTEVGEVKAGDQATITPANSSTTLSGTVASVSLIASSSGSSVAAFPVVIDVTGSPTGIYPGATATVDIVVKQLAGVVEIPTAAISYAGGQATVTEVLSGATHKTVDVSTGITLNGMTQISSGLHAGETIVEQVTSFKASGGGAARSLFGGAGSSRAGAGGFSGRGGPPGGGGGPPTGGGSFGGSGG